MRSQALAYTYQLPQAQPLPGMQPPVQPQQPFQDEVGNPAEGLQQVDGVTQDYFDQWAALKGFARDVWENYGVDVRYPDPSVPESNKLHRMYLKSIAALKMTGDKLKTGQRMYEQATQRGDLFNADPQSAPMQDLNLGTDVVSKDLDPITTEANTKLRQLFFEDAIKPALEYYEEMKQKFDRLAAERPNQKDYWLRQKDALVKPTKSEKEFSPYTGRAAAAKEDNKINAAGSFLKKMEALRNGTAESYKLSSDVFGPNGERVYVSKDLSGDMFGGSGVARWEYIPSLGTTTLVTTDKDGKVTRRDVTNSDPMSVAKGVTSENPRYAEIGSYLDIYADKSGIRNPETSEVNPLAIRADDADQRYDNMKKELETEDAISDTAKEGILRRSLRGLESGTFIDDDQDFQSRDGRSINVVRRKNGFEISNIREIMPNLTKEQLKVYKSLSEAAVMKFLLSQGAHQAMTATPEDIEKARKSYNKKSGTTSAPATTGTNSVAPQGEETEAQRLLREIRERRKNQQ